MPKEKINPINEVVNFVNKRLKIKKCEYHKKEVFGVEIVNLVVDCRDEKTKKIIFDVMDEWDKKKFINNGIHLWMEYYVNG
jgi:hypothetical protein